MRSIHVAAAAVVRGDGRALLVRKRGTTLFMQPGGKLEAGETAEQAVRRELAEEVGIEDVATTYAGTFEADAANETGHTVRADVFLVRAETAEARAEIEELVWVDPQDPGDVPLAPLTALHVLPLLAAAATFEG